MRTIERIHDAARQASVTSLDRPVYLDRSLALYSLIDRDYVYRSVYIDVPVSRIVALGREDFWENGDTWRDVAERLHGKDWSDVVFSYFDQPLKENEFPAPSSLYPLRLAVYGGVAECANGNHRLVAGRAWLSDKYGEKALFHKVKVRVASFTPLIASFMATVVADRGDILHARPGWLERERYPSLEEVKLYLKNSKHPDQVWAWVGDELQPIKRRFLWLGRFRRFVFRSMIDNMDWRRIPLDIVEEMLDDTWVARQMSAAEVWHD